MSGLWSFREAPTWGPDTRVGGGGPSRELAVTRVLPVGVEYRNGTQNATSVPAHETAESKEGAQGTVWATSDAAPAASLPASGVEDVCNCVSGDAVQRGVAVEQVQRSWWLRLGADVRPVAASLLLAEPAASKDEAWKADTEALHTAQSLLRHAAGGAPKETPVPEALEVEKSSRTLPGACRRVSLGKTSTARASPVTLDTQQGSQRCVARLTGAWDGASLGGLPAPDLRGCSGSYLCSPSVPSEEQQHSHSPAAAAAPPLLHENMLRLRGCSSSPSLGAPGATATKASTFTCSADTATSAAPLAPSPPTVARGAAAGAAALIAVSRQEGLVLLRRYFAVWLAASDERRIRRCATTYHEFLMRCVKEALGQVPDRIQEGDR